MCRVYGHGETATDEFGDNQAMHEHDSPGTGDSRRTGEARDAGRRTISLTRRVFFLLARATRDMDRMPLSLGENDVFESEHEALDALDVHFAWTVLRHPDRAIVESAQWYLQSAMVGPRTAPSLGEVYLATTDSGNGATWAAAGGFRTEAEVVHWAPFVSAARPRIRSAHRRPEALELAYRGDVSVRFGQTWFAPMHSVRVYPKRITVGTMPR